MIIFLYGADGYRRSQKFDEILESYKQKQSVFSLDFFDFELNNGEFFRFKDFLAQQFIFSSKKLAGVKNISKLGEDKIKILAEIIKPVAKDESNIVVISDPETPAAALGFLLKEPVISQKFDGLSGEKLKFFARKEAEARGFSLSGDALEFLAAVFEGDTWGLITELDKLKFCGQAKLTAKDLEKFGHYPVSPNIFSFIGGIIKNFPAARNLITLEYSLSGEDPAAIFNILASRSGLNFKLLEKLADADTAVKSGKLDYALALLKLCLN